MTPRFTPCCADDLLLEDVVELAAGLLVLPPEPEPEPELGLAEPELAEPELGAELPVVGLLLFVPVAGVLGAAVVWDCPSTEPVTGTDVVVVPPWANWYATAPPRPRVATTLSVMKTIATRSLMGHLPLASPERIGRRFPTRQFRNPSSVRAL
ncbi:MAG TPA: hypothetical protein VKR79_08070 [Gaiellaceae bacterium]|nr:hypothetical protein [Gaiellaceae bacterium]